MATASEEAAKPRRKTTRRAKPGPKPGAKAAREAAAMNGEIAPAPQAGVAIRLADQFKFALNYQVTITQSKETGTVRARAQWATGNISYFVAYTTKSGEFKEAWIDEDLLTGFVERRKRAK